MSKKNSKRVIYNAQTRDLRITQSEFNGPKWNKFIKEGYIWIGIAVGYNCALKGLNNN